MPLSVNEVKSKTWRLRDEKHQAKEALVIYLWSSKVYNIVK